MTHYTLLQSEGLLLFKAQELVIYPRYPSVFIEVLWYDTKNLLSYPLGLPYTSRPLGIIQLTKSYARLGLFDCCSPRRFNSYPPIPRDLVQCTLPELGAYESNSAAEYSNIYSYLNDSYGEDADASQNEVLGDLAANSKRHFQW
ncbi:hypothetical protein H112_06050 [Trichophyton rubrum D6]|uniref:Uncharacterized protein n=3 Tax=Trichophyton TaxID=5550 RepID=A0A080WME6_TRIRC|nr:uncharacterized protein TERG_12044 [Trichophyton rubrum CBS 118892]EZF14885.1 hypothetical protein H100_06064 [Trichophyton rubrum MR850]EZF39866.1 hypothetical protein H102_06033 [Trichophyton rubrum CBS 100081]EZF50549.1 hypothetical protein H103_06057 [Trichophyton rubrum CBS 288.86]EZF61186.1 hypothetical protein H104_06046 [Trichophyton rubrum CBS 289.86]EZF71817.1 hypothetical protein H105_06071 [Trichophyton soudanense CBS 452.61]EZF82399.1 hypothetical protein H110_06054 [Trichophy